MLLVRALYPPSLSLALNVAEWFSSLSTYLTPPLRIKSNIFQSRYWLWLADRQMKTQRERLAEEEREFCLYTRLGYNGKSVISHATCCGHNDKNDNWKQRKHNSSSLLLLHLWYTTTLLAINISYRPICLRPSNSHFDRHHRAKKCILAVIVWPRSRRCLYWRDVYNRRMNR